MIGLDKQVQLDVKRIDKQIPKSDINEFTRILYVRGSYFEITAPPEYFPKELDRDRVYENAKVRLEAMSDELLASPTIPLTYTINAKVEDETVFW